jgi:hypothetical protein
MERGTALMEVGSIRKILLAVEEALDAAHLCDR